MTQPLRSKDDLIQGSISLRDASEFVPELDEHLGALSSLFHQYLKYAWVSELDVPTYSRLARNHCLAVFGQLDAVGRATVAFGGVPLGSPIEHANRSYLAHEDEGVYAVGIMLERSLRFEGSLLLRLGITLEAAEDVGAERVEVVLRSLIAGAKIRRAGSQLFLEGGDDGQRS